MAEWIDSYGLGILIAAGVVAAGIVVKALSDFMDDLGVDLE